MSTMKRMVEPGTEIFVRIEDFTPPWQDSPVVLLLHGTAETSDAFRLWTPWLARRFRVVAPDWRGMGSSSRLTDGARLDMETLVNDVHSLMQSLGVPNYFVVGEKLGALAALSLAAQRPQDVRALSVACGMV